MYKLAIENKVDVPVKFTLKQGKVNKTFSFSLTCTRLEQEELTARMQEHEFKYKEFLQSPDVVLGWEGQRLVLDQNDQPVEFSPEALDMMLRPQGVAHACFNAYQKECGAKEKN